MTTKVRILNEGPDAITVEPQGKDAQGRFTDAGEPQRVEPRQYIELHVHSTQDLHIRELK